MEQIVSWLSSNLSDIFSTIFSTLVGAWLAYRWSEKIQNNAETRQKQKEYQKDKENKMWQLNYLNIFLHMHLVAFIELFSHLKEREQIINLHLLGQEISQKEKFYILQPLADFHIDFPLDTEGLLFTANDEEFVKGISLVKTSLNNYYNAIQMLNTNLKPFQMLLVRNEFSKEQFVALQQILLFLIEETALAISVFHKMQKVVLEYNQKNDKLLLNVSPEFDKGQLATIADAEKIRKQTLQRLKSRIAE